MIIKSDVLYSMPISAELWAYCLRASEKIYNSRHGFLRKKEATGRYKAILDHAGGIAGEFATKGCFGKKYRFKCSDVDTKVYNYGKSFGADLHVEDSIKIDVKSQMLESAKEYSISWTYQHQQGISTDAIFKDESNRKDRLESFVLVDVSNSPRIPNTAYVLAIVPATTLFDKDCFEPPKLDYYKDRKKCVYLETLYEHNIILSNDEIRQYVERLK